jgi:hypothetical protein
MMTDIDTQCQFRAPIGVLVPYTSPWVSTPPVTVCVPSTMVMPSLPFL